MPPGVAHHPAGKKKPATHGGGRHRYPILKFGTGEYYAHVDSLFVPGFYFLLETMCCDLQANIVSG
jgi:hypothetical protein